MWITIIESQSDVRTQSNGSEVPEKDKYSPVTLATQSLHSAQGASYEALLVSNYHRLRCCSLILSPARLHEWRDNIHFV